MRLYYNELIHEHEALQNMKLFRTSVRLCKDVVHLTLKYYIFFFFFILYKSQTFPTYCGTELWRNV
jgi:hypothetical protein